MEKVGYLHHMDATVTSPLSEVMTLDKVEGLQRSRDTDKVKPRGSWYLQEHGPVKSSKRIIDLTGLKFGKLLVLHRFGSLINSHTGSSVPVWQCLCDCGNSPIIRGVELRTGRTKSCGCLIGETVSARMRAHRVLRGLPDNFTSLGAYKSWRAMKERCDNKNNSHYTNYGGRGITYTPEWEKFENFYKCMGDRPEGLTLDRLDVNLGYCKENCRWADATVQARNARSNRRIEFKGETKLLVEWAEGLGITSETLSYRLAKWGKEKAMTTYGNTSTGGRRARTNQGDYSE